MSLPRAIAFVSLLLISGLVLAQASDHDLRRNIVGTWLGIERRVGVLVRGTNTLKPNGEFEVVTTVERAGADTLRVEAGGVWKIEGGVLTQVITRSTDEKLAPSGSVSRDRIAQLDDRTLELVSENGYRQLRERQ